jgi:hypothetical protein
MELHIEPAETVTSLLLMMLLLLMQPEVRDPRNCELLGVSDQSL